jgi:DNA polymerase-3 subunit gamma/tau
MVFLRLLAFKPQPINAANNATTAQKKTLTTAPIPRTDPAHRHSAPQAVTAAPKAEPIVMTDAPVTLTEPGQAPSAKPLRVQTLPVRQATEPKEKLAPKTLVLTEEGHFWTETVRRLIGTEAISALVRELALQSQLIARDTDQWHLRIESESLNQGVARERLQAALHAAGHSVKLVVEIGKVSDSPAQRNAAALAEKQKAAEDLIHADPLVQAMVQDFGAKIVPGSIRLIS